MWADSSDRTRRSTPLNPDFVGEDIRDLPDKRHQAVTDGLWQVKPALAGSRPLAGRSTGAWATTRSIPRLARALDHQVTRRTGGIARTPARRHDRVADLNGACAHETATDLANHDVIRRATQKHGPSSEPLPNIPRDAHRAQVAASLKKLRRQLYVALRLCQRGRSPGRRRPNMGHS